MVTLFIGTISLLKRWSYEILWEFSGNVCNLTCQCTTQVWKPNTQYKCNKPMHFPVIQIAIIPKFVLCLIAVINFFLWITFQLMAKFFFLQNVACPCYTRKTNWRRQAVYNDSAYWEIHLIRKEWTFYPVFTFLTVDISVLIFFAN